MAEAQKDKKEDPKEAFERLTGTQKSAILMMLIGEEEAAEILKKLVSTRGPASGHGDVFRSGSWSGSGQSGS